MLPLGHNSGVTWLAAVALCVIGATEAHGACGGTVRKWLDPSSNNWNTDGNWDTGNRPDTTSEDVEVISAERPLAMRQYSIGCFNNISGRPRCRTATTKLTITGDYFKNLTASSLQFCDGASNRPFTLKMGGSTAQTLENVDELNHVEIGNNSTVTITDAFDIATDLLFTAGWTGTLKIQADMQLKDSTFTFTIPSGGTVEVESGATFDVTGDITINGTLKIKSGSTVVVGNGKTVTVASGGSLILEGTDGNIAALKTNGSGNSFTLDVDGTIDASYFRIDRLTSAGVNVSSTGTVAKLEDGEFHYLANNGVAVTLASGATVTPNDLDDLGFFDDDAHGTVSNLDATNFTRAPNLSLDNWSGDAGGSANEIDPGGYIDWGTEAATRLTVSDNTAAGNPTDPVGLSATDVVFGTWAFALNKVDTETNIKSIKFTQIGAATASDFSNVRLYRDNGTTSCVWDGSDAQIASGSLSGSPPTITFSGITNGHVATSSTTAACVHLVADTGSNVPDQTSMQFEISATADVSNEKTGAPTESYTFASASGPPVAAPGTTLSPGVPRTVWDGSAADANWTRNGNWAPSGEPNSTRSGKIGAGSPNTYPLFNGGGPWEMLNAEFQNGGGIDFASTANVLGVYGNVDLESGFNFDVNSNAGILSFKGSAAQSINEFATEYPKEVQVEKTGTSDTVSLTTSATFGSTFVIKEGTFKIADGAVLLVKDDVTVENGGTLEIEAGGTLKLANGKTLTIDSGGKLKMVGTGTEDALMTGELSTTGYDVVVNGTIEARYYHFDNLNSNGVTINSGATIDATNHLQDGNWTYPVDNNGTMLTLNLTVPTNSMDDNSFSLDGSSATNVTNIDTTGIGSSSGTLTLDKFSGDIAGSSYDAHGTGCSGSPCYDINWTGAVNTIDFTQEATSPANVDAGTTGVAMGRYGLKQTLAGSDFYDADIDAIIVTLTGTGTSGDITAVRLYYDDNCDSAGGTLIGNNTFSGNPPTASFAFTTDATNYQNDCAPSSADLCIPANDTTTEKKCVYVEYDIATGAGNGNTVGAQVTASSDIYTDLVNGATYDLAPSVTLPLTLGSPTSIIGSAVNTWNGGTSTDWFTGSNWSEGSAPTSTENCDVVDATNDPVIGAGTATCRRLRILSGGITMTNGVGANLEVYGDYINSGGTLTQNDGVFKIRDAGSAITQTIESTTAIDALTFNKTSGGNADVGGTNLTINTLTIPSGSNFDFRIPDGQNLVLTNGLTLTHGVFNIQGGGVLKVPSGQTITVNGGTFKTTGTNDGYPQTSTNKGKITNNGSGRWSFSATSGTVDLNGFWIDNIEDTGLQITGSTVLSKLQGGQFTNLETNYVAPVKAVQINTTGSVPVTATNVGFNWDGFNSFWNDPCTNCPAITDNYYLVYASACSNNTINFDQWFGDFFKAVDAQPATEDKIYDTDDTGPTCQIGMAASASPVSLLNYTATPYNGAVSLDWETASELDHAGFNVFRSTSPHTGYIQVNNGLIRNFNTSSSFHGLYRYVDNDVINGVTYYYYIEDVSYQGTTEWHGPESARPLSSLDAPPADTPGSNTGGSSPGAGTGNDPTPGEIQNPDLVDLGNGVHVLSKTANALRIEVIPPAAVFTTSTWNASYETVAVPGYATMIDAGKPELLQRNILIEVDPHRESAGVLAATVTEAANSTHVMAPAPHWTLDGNGVLQPSWTPDASAYADTNFTPAAFYSVKPQLRQVGAKKFVEITVHPFLYRASDDTMRELDKLVLDIGLDGYEWDDVPPAVSEMTPAASQGSLRIRYDETGVYSLTFQDLKEAGVEGPFEGVSVDALRLYKEGEEIPLEIISADGTLGSGDELRFFGEHRRTLEDVSNEVVLTRYPIGSSGQPLRVAAIDGDPSGLDGEANQWTYANAEAEENWAALFDTPVADGADRFYWRKLFVEAGAASLPGDPWTYQDVTIATPGLIIDQEMSAYLQIRLSGRGSLAIDQVLKIAVSVNGEPLLAEADFQSNTPTFVTLTIPQSYFVGGENSVRVQAIGDDLPGGEWGIIYFDRLKIHYNSYRQADNGAKQVHNFSQLKKLSIHGFDDSSLSVYDVSDESLVARLDNVDIVSEGVMEDGIEYFTATLGAHPGPNGENGYRYFVYQDDALLTPTALSLTKGYDQMLRDSDRQADMIVVGSVEMLSAAWELIAHREAQGLRVTAVPLDQIYAEFSHGLTSSSAIREFINFALDHWQAPQARYLLFVGDGTYDPHQQLQEGLQPHATPVYLEKGLYVDFANDNWFATGEGSDLPRLAVGRIPSAEPAEMYDYVNKLVEYDSGLRAPSAEESEKLYFVSDDDTMQEGFAANSRALAQAASGAHPPFVTEQIDQAGIGDDTQMVAQIESAFHNAPLLINYLGHGAEQEWTYESVLDNAKASALDNEKLPIVMAMNCLNAYYYHNDPSYRSLGEKLLLNPQGGAIAFIGSTTMTLPTAQVNLARELLNRLGEKKGKPQTSLRFGDLFLESKIALGDTPANVDTLKSFSLLGDPSTPFPAHFFPPPPEADPLPTANSPNAPAPPSTERGEDTSPDEVVAAIPKVDEPSGGGGDHRPFHKKLLGCSTISGGDGPLSVLSILLLPLLFMVGRGVGSRRKSSKTCFASVNGLSDSPKLHRPPQVVYSFHRFWGQCRAWNLTHRQ